MRRAELTICSTQTRRWKRASRRWIFSQPISSEPTAVWQK